MTQAEVIPGQTGPTAPETPPEQQQAPVENQRPAWLPEGFDTPEALAQAYTELSAKAASAPPAKPGETKETPAGGKADETVQSIVSDAGLDLAALNGEILQQGALSAESREKLVASAEKRGITADLVDRYLAGQQALAQNGVNDILSAAGGAEGYQAMREWAQRELPADQLKAISDVVESGNVEQAKAAVGLLYGRYTAATGAKTAPQRVRAENGASVSGGFRDAQEYFEARQSPRYAKDTAYRRDVEERLARSIPHWRR